MANRLSVVSAMTLAAVPPTFDTVGIAFPVSDWDRVGCDVHVTNYGTAAEGYRFSRRLEGGGFLATGAGRMAWVEASLPKRVAEDNVHALGLDDALEALEGLYSEALGFVEDDGSSFLDAKIVRLDLVRDFRDCGDAGVLLDGLAGVPQPGRVKVRRFSDPARGAAETLRVGPKAWGCTLYDKYRESKGAAPIGSLRFETRLHQEQLTSVWARGNGGHLRVVEDLIGHDGDGERRTGELARNWFGRAGFDTVMAAGTLLSNAVLEMDLSATLRAGLWAYLTLPGFAMELSVNTRRRYRRLSEDCGVAPSVFDVNDSPRSVRLDYQTGRLLAA